jgi:hypothetical protein
MHQHGQHPHLQVVLLYPQIWKHPSMVEMCINAGYMQCMHVEVVEINFSHTNRIFLLESAFNKVTIYMIMCSENMHVLLNGLPYLEQHENDLLESLRLKLVDLQQMDGTIDAKQFKVFIVIRNDKH